MTLPSLLEVDQPDPREATLRQVDWLWQTATTYNRMRCENSRSEDDRLREAFGWRVDDCTPDHNARHSYASMLIASGAEPRADGRGQISSGGLA